MSLWFRWYGGTCEDKKFRAVVRTANRALGETGRNVTATLAVAIATWAALLETASNDERKGFAAIDGEDIAALLDLDDGVADAVLAAMCERGILAFEDGGYSVTAWNKRQFQSDSSAERVRRHRARQRSKPQRNDDVTLQEREETPPDTETDSESPQTPAVSPPQGAAAPWWAETTRGKRFPKEVVEPPDEFIDFATVEGHRAPHRAWASFRDYWLAKSGANATKKDWLATWRNWIRKDVEDGRDAPPSQQTGGQGRAGQASSMRAFGDLAQDVAARAGRRAAMPEFMED